MKNILPVCLALLSASSVFAEDWPAWRGPRGDGTSLETNVPVRWGPKDNIRWKTAIPGIGHSSPVVAGDRVFVTTCLLEKQQRVLVALDRDTGKIVWQRVVVTAPLEPKHKLNSFASSTPATDGKHVWVTFLSNVNLVAACYDMSGKLVWKTSPGEFHSRHGFCSPPIPYKDLVIVNGDQDALAYIVALEKNTGMERWRADRPNRTRSYCPPLVADAAGKKQLVLTGSKSVASYDPDTGKQIWLIDGPTEQFVASVVYGSGLFFLTAGYPEYHNMAIRPDGTGNITRTHVAWHEKNVPARKASYVPSPIAFGHYFYVVSDLGWLNAFEASSGRRLWMKQLGRHHSASPVLAEGRLYFTDDDGVTYVLKAGPAYQLMSRNPLNDECYSSPAVSSGRIYVRTLHYLWCIGKR
jgi:outer membrane protein assembly factor BamB